MDYKFDSKKELRDYVQGRTIQGISVGGVMPGEVREIQIRFDDGHQVLFRATNWQSIEVTA